MEPNKILDTIQEAMVREELAVPVYTSHIKASLFWSGLDLEKQQRIIEVLEILARESEGHVFLLKRVKEIFTSKYLQKQHV